MSTHYKSDGKININQLEHLGNSIIDNDAKFKTLVCVPGVLRLPGTISNNFEITVQDQSYINVGYIATDESNAPFGGVALDKKGRTISITKNQAYVGSVDGDIDTAITFNINDGVWSPSRSDDPQLAGFGELLDGGYKRNSGNYNIPIKLNSMNYVYIKYVEIVKQTSSSSQVVSGVSYETEYTDGYCILVTQSTLADTDYIYLGQVDATADTLNSNNNMPKATNSMMQLGYLNGSVVGAEYHAQTGWSSYPTLSGEYIDLETHVNALGTGIPSATNPHGLSAADIGANVNNAGFTSVNTMMATADGTYLITSPILDLTSSGAAEAYDVILVDAINAPENSNVTIRLPEANINTTAYKYTIKSVGTSANTTVSISSIINTSSLSNYIDGGSVISSADATYSMLELNASEPVTLVVGLTSSGYNWWRI